MKPEYKVWDLDEAVYGSPRRPRSLIPSTPALEQLRRELEISQQRRAWFEHNAEIHQQPD